MKYYHRRVYADYRKDLETAWNVGMRDTEDSLMFTKEFAYWAKHIMEIAHRKNVEYASVGILDRNDLIQLASQCFIEAYSRVNWVRINNLPVDERQKALWGFLKSSTDLKFGTRIREYKDGIKVPDREMFSRADTKSDKEIVFDAISSLFPQLTMETAFAHVEDYDDSSYHNELLVEILNNHFTEYLNPKERLIFEMSMGFDRDKMIAKDIAKELGTSESAIKVTKNRAMNKLKSKEAMQSLAWTLDGAMIPTGANILEILK